MSGERNIDELTGIETTGHSWDGIKELNNPLPRWWLWTLYGTIVFALGYVIAYPAIPGLNSASKGQFQWSSRGDVRQELAVVEQNRQSMNEKIASMDLTAILADQDVRNYAVSAGSSMFKVYCSQCHGSGAQGGPGFPNLNDDSWLWGGTPEQILQTITHGVRDTASAETRESQMPAFGKDAILTAKQISQVTQHVLQMAALDHVAEEASAGAAIYTENCAACHGEVGQGKQDLGAPQLNDAIWFYGNSSEQIANQVKVPKHGMMPSWQGRLGDSKVKQLAAYVLSLGGGQ